MSKRDASIEASLRAFNKLLGDAPIYVYERTARPGGLADYEQRCQDALERATLAMLVGRAYTPTERALAGSRWIERGNE